jgi:tetratricopeptide (TPR) repeat protein
LPDREILLNTAQELIESGDITNAIEQFIKIKTLFPKDIRSRQQLADLLIQDGRDGEALNELLVVARHYQNTGFYLKAIDTFQKVLEISPARIDIHEAIADLQTKQGFAYKALKNYHVILDYQLGAELNEKALITITKIEKILPKNLYLSICTVEVLERLNLQELAYSNLTDLLEILIRKKKPDWIVAIYRRFHGIIPPTKETWTPFFKALDSCDSLNFSDKNPNGPALMLDAQDDIKIEKQIKTIKSVFNAAHVEFEFHPHLKYVFNVAVETFESYSAKGSDNPFCFDEPNF